MLYALKKKKILFWNYSQFYTQSLIFRGSKVTGQLFDEQIRDYQSSKFNSLNQLQIFYLPNLL